MRRVTFREFTFLILQLLIVFLLISQGGLHIYNDRSTMSSQDSIRETNKQKLRKVFKRKPTTDTITKRDSSLVESPDWFNMLFDKYDNFEYNINSHGAIYKANILVKAFFLFVIVGWVLIRILMHNFRRGGLELYILLAVKLLLIFFFLISGFIKTLGQLDPIRLFDLGNILDLPSLESYFTFTRLPLSLAIVLAWFDIIIIHFRDNRNSAPPAAQAPPAHH